MTLKDVKKEYENLDWDFRNVANHEQAEKHEKQILLDTLTSIAEGKLKGLEAVEVAKCILELRRFI